MDDDEDVEEEYELRPLRFDPILPLAATFDLLSQVTGALSEWFDTLSSSLCCHFKFKEQRAAIHEQAALEIETLTKE